MAARPKANPKYVTPKFIAEEFGYSRSAVQARLDSGAIYSVSAPPADPNARKTIRRIPWSEVERLRKLNGKKKTKTTTKTSEELARPSM